MWHALRAELAYFRPWLLGGLGLAAGVTVFVSAIFLAVGDDGPESHVTAFLRGMFLVMAPMVVAFVIQSYRSEERRARLLLAGPLTPWQLAAVSVFLPTVLVGVGVLAAGLVMGVGFLISGRVEVESLHIVGYVAGMLFMMTLMGLLGQEATAARRQGRLQASIVGWAGFVVAVLVLTALALTVSFFQWPLSWMFLHLGNLVVAVAAMAASVSLYARRTDFTR